MYVTKSPNAGNNIRNWEKFSYLIIYLWLTRFLLVRDICLDRFFSYLTDHFSLTLATLVSLLIFSDGLEDWFGCIAETPIRWSQIDAIFKCLLWMMGFAEIMHFFMDLPVISSWTLQLYFGIILCYLCCLGSRLIFSHGWEIIYFFWIMCAMILSEFMSM